MASKFRLVSLFAVLAIAMAVFAIGQIGDGTKGASADIVPGEYSLEAETQGVPGTGPFATTFPVGSVFSITVRVDHAGPAAPCSGSAGEFGCYQAAQFRLNYDEAVIDTTTAAMAKHPSAPAACTSESVTDAGPASFALAGCLSLAGADIDYSGPIYVMNFTCAATPGVTAISLEPKTTSPGSFINDSAADQADHLHVNDNNAGAPEPNLAMVSCVNVADIVAAKSGPATVNAGASVAWTFSGTNTGPATWIGGVIADDLPGNGLDLSGCLPALTPGTCAVGGIDVNGDSTVDSPAACLYVPLISPNPFGLLPDPILDAIACPAALTIGATPIAVGGKITATVTVDTLPDSCNQALVDNSSASGDSPTAPLFGVPGVNLDPDFLDGISGTEDNFATFTTQVGDCPVSIVKAGPSSATVGDTGIPLTLTVTNAGPSDATNVVVTDVVDPGLDVTAVSAGCVEAPANTVTCTTATLAPGPGVVHTITVSTPNAGLFCNDASGTWVRAGGGNTTSNEICFTVLPPFNGLVKAVDINGDTDTDDPGETPAAGETTIEVNLWLCADQSSDGIDNNGDSTVDNEPNTCPDDFEIQEQLYTPTDCDSRNDDDDGDGDAVSNDPASPGFDPLCPLPTLQDYIDGNVDKNGGELPEGIGAFEFQLKFDHKIFDINITPGTDWLPAGRTANCSMTIVSENDIRFGCVSVDDPPTPPVTLGFPQLSGAVAATISVSAEADLPFRIRPGKDNGVVRRLLDENCEVADIIGGPLTALQDIKDGIDNNGDTVVDEPNENLQPNVGLTPDCTDIDITIRRLEGDLDMDCNVDVLDAQRIAFRYGSFFGQLLYDTFFDMEPFVTPDFDIDIKDLQFVFGRIGSTCADPIPNSQEPQSANGVGQP